MRDLTRRDLLKKVLGSTLATWMVSQEIPALGQGVEPLVGLPTLSEAETDHIATQRVALLLRPPTVADDINDNKRWNVTNLDLPNSRRLEWHNRDLYDISGNLLFRDKTRTLPSGEELMLRTAASPLLVTPVWQESIGEPLPIGEWIVSARRMAKENGLIPVDGPQQVVCYSYPKLGLLCKDQNFQAMVVDLGDAGVGIFQPYRVKHNVDSDLVWSPYAEFFDEKRRAFLEGPAREVFSKNLKRLFDVPFQKQDSVLAKSEAAYKATKECGLNLNLAGQDNNYYCACATAVMLLAFHGIKKSQSDAAAVMHPVNPSGCTVDDQIRGYRELSKSGKPPVETLSAVCDPKPTSDKCRNEICNRKLPLKSAFRKHARAVGGWHELADGSHEQFVYDPWPTKRGKTYWEAFGHKLTNFIFVRPK